MAERGAKHERGAYVDADDDAGLWCEAQLARTAGDHIPRLPTGVGERLVRVIGAEAVVDAELTVGARPV